MKRKIIFRIIIVSVLIIAYVSFAQIYGKKRDRINFEKFYGSVLNGEIIQIEIKYHQVGFQLKNDSIEYIFDPETNALNGNKIFEQTASIGDSLIKGKYSDTLILKIKGVEYGYTFNKLGIE